MIGQSEAQRIQVQGLHQLLGTDAVLDWTLAIDGGAHVGTWSAVMAGYFDRVIAFEPTPETFGMLTENMADFPNVECRNVALMDRHGRISMERPEYSIKLQKAFGKKVNDELVSRYAQWSGNAVTEAITIDSLQLSTCGLIKLDLEGAEFLALKGAEQTIARLRPVLVIEVKRHSHRYGIKRYAVHDLMVNLGYKERFHCRYDVFYVYS